MALNLTAVYENVNNIQRKIFYGENITLKFFEMNRLILEIDKGFYIPTIPTTNLALGAEYFEAKIAIVDENIDLFSIIPRSDKVVSGNRQYRIAQYFVPRDVTEKWILRLESSGKYKHGETN